MSRHYFGVWDEVKRVEVMRANICSLTADLAGVAEAVAHAATTSGLSPEGCTTVTVTVVDEGRERLVGHWAPYRGWSPAGVAP